MSMLPPISRVTRSKSEAKVTYDRLSRWYDMIAGRSEKAYRDKGLQLLQAQPDDVILEIGYGTGHCLVQLAQAVGPNGRIAGVDISEGMQTQASNRLQQAGLVERVVLYVQDATTLPFADGEFDAIFMSFTLELFDTPEIPVVLRECYRTLRPKGRLVIVSLVKREKDNIPVRLYEWAHRVWPNYVDCRPILAQQALKQAGFGITKLVSMMMWGLPVEIILVEKAPKAEAEVSL